MRSASASRVPVSGVEIDPRRGGRGILELRARSDRPGARRAGGDAVAVGDRRGGYCPRQRGARARRRDHRSSTSPRTASPSPAPLVTRVRWGGSLLEEAQLARRAEAHDRSAARDRTARRRGGEAPPVERFTPALQEADLVVRVRERVGAAAGGVSLAEAKVVVSCGRGAGSPEGFGIIEELAGLLGGAVGCSRAVTMAGWRPHTDQVGQTGTKIAPDIYIACGISGATQHMAGCKGAKAILAVNTDPEAPILASADYAVIGDLHEVVPGDLGRAEKGARQAEHDCERRLRGRARRRDRRRRRALRAPRAVPHPAGALGKAGRAARPTSRRAFGTRRRSSSGQRKLLQRLVPGLVHAFIFWGFVVLFPTIFMAIVRRSSTASRLFRRARRSAGSSTRAGTRSSSTCSPSSCSWAWRPRSSIRKVQRPRAVRGLPPRRGRPHPRADRRASRRRCSSGTRRRSRSA